MQRITEKDCQRAMELIAALAALIDAHARWLQRHRAEPDADEWLYHADALMALYDCWHRVEAA